MGTIEKLSRKKLMKRRLARKRFNAIKTILLIIVIGIAAYKMFEGIFIYPEEHQTTARYQLQLKLEQGDEEAEAYYKENYTDRGVYLYGEK